MEKKELTQAEAHIVTEIDLAAHRQFLLVRLEELLKDLWQGEEKSAQPSADRRK